MMSTVYKIFSAILLRRVAPYAQKIIGPYQSGFTIGEPVTDQIFYLGQAVEKLLECGHQLHDLFVDYKDIYDTPARVKL